MKKLTFLFLLPLLVCGFYVGSVDTVHELRTIINPHGGMTNLFVKEINSIVSWAEGDVTATNALPDGPFDSIRGTGRWYPVIKAFGGTITNIQITTNITVVMPGSTNYVELWMITNSVMQPVHLDLPLFWTNMVVLGPGMSNVLYRQTNSLIYSSPYATNTGASLFALKHGITNRYVFDYDFPDSGANGISIFGFNGTNYVVFGSKQNGADAHVQAGSGGSVWIAPNVGSSGGYVFTTSALMPDWANKSLGSVANTWTNGFFGGPIYLYGHRSGIGYTNYSNLAISHTGTNGSVVLNSQSGGTAVDPRSFMFQAGGTNIFAIIVNNQLGSGTPAIVLTNQQGHTVTLELNDTVGVIDTDLHALYTAADIILISRRIVPSVDNVSDLGSSASNGALRDIWQKGSHYIQGFNDGSGNYSRLSISHGGTNTFIVFDSQVGGTGGETRPILFNFGGTNRIHFDPVGVITAYGRYTNQAGGQFVALAETGAGAMSVGQGFRAQPLSTATASFTQTFSPPYLAYANAWDSGGSSNQTFLGIMIEEATSGSPPLGMLNLKNGPVGYSSAGIRISSLQDVYAGGLGVNALTNLTRTTNFFYVSAVQGIPAGTPAGSLSGYVPITVDTSNHKMYFYSGGSWRQVTSAP